MSVSKEDEKLFSNACEKIIGAAREKNGIGTLGEKTLHAVLKEFYEPDREHQEIKIGSFVADIFKGEEIIEIQTRSFHAMRKKLDFFLEKYPVTIVYPIIHSKWLFWIDEATGEVTQKRKSPKTGTPCDAFYELYRIKPYLTHENLHLCLVLIDAEEYRLLNGWSENRKRGSTRYDRIPKKLVDEYYISGTEDYVCMLPESLPSPFTAKDFAKFGKISPRAASFALSVLTHIGLIRKTGKKGRAYLYQVNKLQ